MAIAQYMPSRAGSPQPGLARVEEARRAAALVPVGARRAAADAGCRSWRRASDGGRLSPLFGRAAGGSPALHDSAYSPLRRGSDSASRRVALWLAGRRLRSRSASPRPRRSPLQLPLSVAAPPPSQPPAADAGSRGDRGVQHSRQQQRADATFAFRFRPSPADSFFHRAPRSARDSPTCLVARRRCHPTWYRASPEAARSAAATTSQNPTWSASRILPQLEPGLVSRYRAPPRSIPHRRRSAPPKLLREEVLLPPTRTRLGIARYLAGGTCNYNEQECSFPQIQRLRVRYLAGDSVCT